MDDKPFVVMAPVGNVQVRAGAAKDMNLDFRVGSGIPHQFAHPEFSAADPYGYSSWTRQHR